jgi:lysophospholipase L1-like esterase
MGPAGPETLIEHYMKTSKTQPTRFDNQLSLFHRLAAAGSAADIARAFFQGALFAGALLIAAGPAMAQTAPAATRPCPEAVKAELLQGDLSRFAARFGRSRSLKIVTIGSSSTAGAGATSPANSYPNQLEDDLLRRFPGHDIDVVNAGANGQEVPDMLVRLDRDVLAYKPDLVIWQFGSNGLLRGRPLAELEEGARVGIQRLKQGGAEVILMDLQHAPRIDGVAARDEVLRMMERLSTSTGTPLFHRYRLMKAWAGTMGDGYRTMVAADQLHMTDASYRCMAGELAARLQGAVNQLQVAKLSPGRLAAAVKPPAPPAGAASAP